MAEMGRWSRYWVNRSTDRRARRLVSRLGADLGPLHGARVLELGSGAGGLVRALAGRELDRYVATDFDPDQLRSARERVAGPAGRAAAPVDRAAVDAARIPFRDGSFDAVFALAMLHHVDVRHGEFRRRPAALREIRRVLRPGGRFVYSEFREREPVRAALAELGFVPVRVDRGWRWDFAVYARGS